MGYHRRMDETSFSTAQSSSEEDVIRFYDDYAETWDGRFQKTPGTKIFIEERWRTFEEALSLVSRRKVAVELGVGTGVYIDKVARLFETVIAVDGSGRMLEVLRNKLSVLGTDNVQVQKANVLNLEAIEDDSVDVVYFFGLLEHVVDVDSFFSEMRRILNINGAIVGVTPNGLSPWYLLRRVIRGTGKHCSSDQYYTKRKLALLVRRHALHLESVRFWGMVPAGTSGFALSALSGFGKVISHSPLRLFLGGLTFVVKKSVVD